MSENLCTVPRCGNPRPEHQYVCVTCVQMLKRDLNEVPSMLAELEVTITRQDVMSKGGTMAKSADTALPFKWGASDALWVLGNVITTWARMLVEHSGFRSPADSSQVGAAKFLLTYVQSLAMHPEAGQAVDEIESAVKNAMRSVDHPVDPRAFLGKCGDVDGAKGCRGRVYALPKEEFGTCERCGEHHHAQTRRSLMLRKMANHKLTASEIATMLAGVGVEISVKQIQDAGRNGCIIATGSDAHGKRSYRVADVLRAFQVPDFLNAA